MREKTSLVVTSIAAPNAALRLLAHGCLEHGVQFIVIGDEKSPADFQLDGCRFYSLAEQRGLDLAFAKKCPARHYARKNIGYLVAMRAAAQALIETDDDTLPEASFWSDRQRTQSVSIARDAGWLNVYRYFSQANIWPRGLPLDAITAPLPEFDSLERASVDCPIQQGLADENPDVDAIYRLVLPLPQNFRRDRRVALAREVWCPFNSQNTTWWRDAFPLLYLPAYCSFRMTDIWRSFIAQRIAWENGWSILFHEPTVRQERNEHSLMRDFKDEVPGYLHNAEMCSTLVGLQLEPGAAALSANLRKSYEKLVSMKWVGEQELELVDAWLSDIAGR